MIGVWPAFKLGWLRLAKFCPAADELETPRLVNWPVDGVVDPIGSGDAHVFPRRVDAFDVLLSPLDVLDIFEDLVPYIFIIIIEHFHVVYTRWVWTD